jgi:hypothetical protein
LAEEQRITGRRKIRESGGNEPSRESTAKTPRAPKDIKIGFS